MAELYGPTYVVPAPVTPKPAAVPATWLPWPLQSSGLGSGTGTLAASFAEGVGLSGRAWRARDLVFVPNLADVTREFTTAYTTAARQLL